jgi:hypothetical protein
VIVIDWGWAQSINYVSTVSAVPELGINMAEFIKFLVATTGSSLDNFHLVGFSLGAHLVGNIGRNLDGNVARVTGEYTF